LDWDDYHGPFREELREYLDNPRYVRRGIGLFLSGPQGTGKTMAANLVLKEFIKREYACYAKIFAQAKEMFTRGWYSLEDQTYFVRRFLHSEILLLDDVGREVRTRVSEGVLDNVLRERAQQGRATIITTNITEGEMASEYSGGTYSLLREKSYDFMYFDGYDWRDNAAERNRQEMKNGETRPIV
jgi:DNA replication protein DnaC